MSDLNFGRWTVPSPRPDGDTSPVFAFSASMRNSSRLRNDTRYGSHLGAGTTSDVGSGSNVEGRLLGKCIRLLVLELPQIFIKPNSELFD